MTNLDHLLDLALTAQRSGAEDDRLAAWNAFAQAAWEAPKPALELMRKRVSSIMKDDEATAELLVTKALSLAPDDFDLSVTLAECYLRRGLEPQALYILKQANAQCPADHFRRDRLLGRAAWLTGDKEAADAAFYRLAAAFDHVAPEVLKETADYFRQNWNRPALRMLLEPLVQRLEGDAEVALWMAEWLIEDQDQEKASAWLKRAEAWSAKRPDFARQVWKSRFALEHPEDERIFRRVVSEVMPESAQAAAAELQELTLRHPGHWEALFFLGTCLRRARNLEPACEALESSVRLAPFAANVLELSGVLGELGRHQEAFDRSVQADEMFEGRNLVAIHNRCLAAIHLGLADEAQAGLKRLEARGFVPELLDELRRLVGELRPHRSGMRFGMRHLNQRR